MHSFEVDGESPQSFVNRVNQAITAKDAGHVVTVAFDGQSLTVRFSYLGQSSLIYDISNTNSGFRAVLKKKKISPFHGPFKRAFDERFEKVVIDLGGKLI